MKTRPQCNFCEGNNLPAQTGNDCIWKYFINGQSHILTAKSFSESALNLVKSGYLRVDGIQTKSLIHYLRDFNVVRDPRATIVAHPSIRVLDNSYVIVCWSNGLCTHEVSGRRDKAKNINNQMSKPKDVYSLSRLLFLNTKCREIFKSSSKFAYFKANWQHYKISSGEGWTGTEQSVREWRFAPISINYCSK